MAAVDLEKPVLETGTEPEFLDDSGPYEEIPDDYSKTERPAIGRLPSFISFDSSKTFEVDQNVDTNVDQNVDTNVDENVKMEEQQEIDERLIWSEKKNIYLNFFNLFKSLPLKVLFDGCEIDWQRRIWKEFFF